ERRDRAAALALPGGQPMCDALEAWPPERLRLRIVLERREMLLADRDQGGGGIGRQARRICQRELAERSMDHKAAGGGARCQIDRIELAQLENVLGIDGVGIAQPMLDLGDGERGWPRRPRRLRHWLVRALHLGREIERASV